jgi:hypothetical protein
MLRWNIRDWASAICGWASAVFILWIVPEACPWKLVSVFATGFCMTWVMRALIPR